ncbi:MAG: hypothetical protein QXP16_06355 [Candidatus Bathyarchaeia archaeon]
MRLSRERTVVKYHIVKTILKPVLQAGSFMLEGNGIAVAELTLGVIGYTETLLAVSGHKNLSPILHLAVVPLYADPAHPVPRLHQVFGIVNGNMQLATVIGKKGTTISVNRLGIIKIAVKNMVIVIVCSNE